MLNATSQAFRDGTNLPESLTRQEKNNNLVDATKN